MVGARLLFSFAASFLALVLWSKTRDAAWMMIVLGTLFLFIDIVFIILELVGLPGYDLVVLLNISVLRYLIPLLPFLFFSIGFIIFLTRARKI